MDFLSQYNANIFQRQTTTFSKTSGATRFNASGSLTSMGGGFILLNAQVIGVTGVPCRLRLYSDEASMIADANRAQGDYNFAPTTALVADIVLTDGNQLRFDPPIIGNTVTGGQLWYNLSGSSAPVQIQLESYPIRPVAESIDGNTNLTITEASIGAGSTATGNITTSKSFLLLSGSATVQSRLRLYSRPVAEVPSGELARVFGTQPSDGSLLIADIMFDTPSVQYPFVPILEGYTWTSDSYVKGNNTVGYALENRTGSTTGITATLYIYSTED